MRTHSQSVAPLTRDGFHPFSYGISYLLDVCVQVWPVEQDQGGATEGDAPAEGHTDGAGGAHARHSSRLQIAVPMMSSSAARRCGHFAQFSSESP